MHGPRHALPDPSLAAADRPFDRLERVHDRGLVRPPEVHQPPVVGSGTGELGHRLLRILPAGAGEPLGHTVYSAPQLKGMQEIITLVVFAFFSVWYLGEPIRWNHIAGFLLIVVAAFLIFLE